MWLEGEKRNVVRGREKGMWLEGEQGNVVRGRERECG